MHRLDDDLEGGDTLFARGTGGGELGGILAGLGAGRYGQQNLVAGAVRAGHEGGRFRAVEIHAQVGGFQEEVEGVGVGGDLYGFAQSDFIAGLLYGEGTDGGRRHRGAGGMANGGA